MSRQLQRNSGGALRPLRKVRTYPVWQSVPVDHSCRPPTDTLDYSQVRQGIASNTKGTAFVVYEDVMDAKQACDKLNGYNFQNRYLVGMLPYIVVAVTVVGVR